MNDYAGYTIKWVTLPWEREQAYALRRQVFCREQGLFADDDRDEIDDHAHLLVALGCVAGWHDRVVGTVRIHQQSPGVWLGSRLAGSLLTCLLYTSPSPRDGELSRMPSSA
nr:MSMEG_0567/Sll0786 family nitrogen starvation N-acetyltransferase [Klebsiella pneumoniae]